jgi:hypothetical protein
MCAYMQVDEFVCLYVSISMLARVCMFVTLRVCVCAHLRNFRMLYLWCTVYSKFDWLLYHKMMYQLSLRNML